MTYARHIRNGRSLPYVAKANREYDELLKEGKICVACGLFFSESLITALRGALNSRILH